MCLPGIIPLLGSYSMAKPAVALTHAFLLQMPDLSMPAWPADRLVFVNDVFFCAGDVIRLLQHWDADVACGMDFMAWKSPPSTNDIQPFGPYGPPLSVGCPAALCSQPTAWANQHACLWCKAVTIVTQH